METRSELLFREFCQQAGWRARRVPTQDRQHRRMPDFVVGRCFRRLAVEVKQVDPNSHDLEQQRRLDAGGIATCGGEPGARLRDHLKEGSAQIKSLTNGRWPGMIVLFDNTALEAYVDSYHIKVAMHGLEQVVFELTGHDSPISRFSIYRFGPKRRMTSTAGTSVSAVAHMRRGAAGTIHLDVFHNEHSSAAMNQRTWSGAAVRHFRLAPPDGDGRREWVSW